MKNKLNFGGEPFVMPSLTEKQIVDAPPQAIGLLCLLSRDRSLVDAPQKTLADLLGVNTATIDGAISYLEACGVLSYTDTENSDFPASQKKKTSQKEQKNISAEKRTKLSELPSYTDAEFSAVLEKRKELSDLITEAQNTLGKIFNVNETKILVSIAEEFGFDEEFLLVLLDFCRKNDHKSMRYIEKLSTSLYDENIRTTEALTEYLHRRETQQTAQTRIRKIFGLGERALTSKEKDFISKWTETYAFDFDMIEKAYEITVNATSKPSLSYTNKILESWYAEGINTVEAVEAVAKKNNEKGTGMSFDVDDFFRAALDRSYRDEKK